ncbi:Lactate racemase [Sporomusa rhizae]|uniref:nickel-dependent lactate racemase n=1 Tax=Sporomusa rhizae TaxID=357999 RepID=UPI00352BC3C8
MFTEFNLGYGTGEINLKLPKKQILHVIEGNHVEPLTDIPAAVKTALANPIGSPRLNQIVNKDDKVCIIVSDITRAWVRNDLFLPPLIDELNACGVPDSNITLVVALGAHRHHTPQENLSTYGQEVVNRVAIEQSCALDTDNFVKIGTTSHGVDTCIHKTVAQSDKVILTGGIVYHLMAGFGGGRKSIMPGVSGYGSIQGNHRFCLHDIVGQGISADCVSGKLCGNMMNENMTEMAAMVKPAFLLNAVITPEGQFAKFVAGHWQEAWLEGCHAVEEIFGVPITAKADLVIGSAGGFPKDINLYQGSKTIDNAFMAAKEGGVVIVLLECRDIKEPPDFSGWFDFVSLHERELKLREGFTVPGFIALKCGLISKQVSLIIVTLPENKDFVEKAGLIPAASLEEAMAIAEQKLGRKDYSVTIMPHAANTVPVMKG